MSTGSSAAPRSDLESASADGRWSPLACPICHGELVWARTECGCHACKRRFEIRDGIPVLLAPDLDARAIHSGNPAVAESGEQLKLRQARFFDEEDAELETCRPHGQPAFYGWLLSEKFRRSVQGVGPLEHLTAVTVCGGSGMDAEFLALSGASVISIDISLGAAQRAQARARRFGVSITPVVADAERLPLAPQAVDVAYVHDGLHHLADPYLGLREMARVARQAVSVTEPARAAATAIAVRFGVALVQEEAGNEVNRLDLREIERLLIHHGFRVTAAERYAMYYQQSPGPPMHLVSRRRVLPLAVSGLLLANRALGRLGNKLTVQAVRAANPVSQADASARTPR